MRHAKSSWASPATTDHDRPLNERGRRDAPLVAARLVQLDWHPDFILSSDAQRTRETAERMGRAWTHEPPEEFTRSLYHAGYEQLVVAVAIVPDDLTTLLVLGHNPGWQELVRMLAGVSVAMKTATAALLRGTGGSWSDALRQRRQWQLMDLIQPREL
jgi:phosphohistidine phosphatase